MPNYLPHELIFDILCKLPVKSLIRLKSMSKSWRSLMEEPQFIDSHLNRTDNSLILQLDAQMDFHLAESDLGKSKQISFPSKLQRSYSAVNVVGSCNGLIVLSCLYADGQDIIIWNVSTREHQILPDLFQGVPYYSYKPSTVFYFGYDAVNCDYKMVIIPFYTFSFVPMVYSLKRNELTWSLSALPNWSNPCGINGVLCGGSVHWNTMMFEDRNIYIRDCIIGFDLGNEEFFEVPLPNNVKRKIALGGLGECLSLTSHDYPFGHGEVWVMKNYMVKESWTKLYSIDIFGPSFVYSKVRDEFLFSKTLGVRTDMYWYNPKMKTTEKVKIACCFRNIVVYKDSLVKISTCLGLFGTSAKPRLSQRNLRKRKSL